jgi:hypothetical protein
VPLLIPEKLLTIAFKGWFHPFLRDKLPIVIWFWIYNPHPHDFIGQIMALVAICMKYDTITERILWDAGS